MLSEFAGVLVRRADLASFVRPLAEEAQRALAAMVTRRRQRVTMMLSERQRLQLAIAVVRPSTDSMIEAIRKQRDERHGQYKQALAQIASRRLTRKTVAQS